MNEVINTILTRRSIRVYNTDKPIAQADLDLILKAGLYAPSGCNAQPWHFTVLQNKEIRHLLNVETKKELLKTTSQMFLNMAKNDKFDIFYNAPIAIIVSMDPLAEAPVSDCAAATQNMLLAAHSLGIGSCWVGLITYLFDSERGEAYRRLLNIPDGYKPLHAAVFGYARMPKPPAPFARRENTISDIK